LQKKWNTTSAVRNNLTITLRGYMYHDLKRGWIRNNLARPIAQCHLYFIWISLHLSNISFVVLSAHWNLKHNALRFRSTLSATRLAY
jgi:hypothetical protein